MNFLRGKQKTKPDLGKNVFISGGLFLLILFCCWILFDADSFYSTVQLSRIVPLQNITLLVSKSVTEGSVLNQIPTLKSFSHLNIVENTINTNASEFRARTFKYVRLNDTFQPFKLNSTALLTLRLNISVIKKQRDVTRDNLALAAIQMQSSKSEDHFIDETGIHLVTTFCFQGCRKNRIRENMAALANNLENPYISKVHVLSEVVDPRVLFMGSEDEVNLRGTSTKQFRNILLKKLVTINVTTQPTYSDMFRYANKRLKRGTIAIISNSDIYFDSTVQCLRAPKRGSEDGLFDRHGEHVRGRSLLALSRHPSEICTSANVAYKDHRNALDICKSYQHSHDSFIFAPPVPEKVIQKINHVQNLNGAENVVIFEFQSAGYVTSNPCGKLTTYHLHCSKARNYDYDKYIDGRVAIGKSGNENKYPHRHGVVFPGTTRSSPNRTHIGVDRRKCGDIIF